MSTVEVKQAAEAAPAAEAAFLPVPTRLFVVQDGKVAAAYANPMAYFRPAVPPRTRGQHYDRLLARLAEAKAPAAAMERVKYTLARFEAVQALGKQLHPWSRGAALSRFLLGNEAPPDALLQPFCQALGEMRGALDAAQEDLSRTRVDVPGKTTTTAYALVKRFVESEVHTLQGALAQKPKPPRAKVDAQAMLADQDVVLVLYRQEGRLVHVVLNARSGLTGAVYFNAEVGTKSAWLSRHNSLRHMVGAYTRYQRHAARQAEIAKLHLAAVRDAMGQGGYVKKRLDWLHTLDSKHREIVWRDASPEGLLKLEAQLVPRRTGKGPSAFVPCRVTPPGDVDTDTAELVFGQLVPIVGRLVARLLRR